MTAEATITVLQPVADEVPEPAVLSERPATLAGASVAFIEHPGPNVSTLLLALEQELVAQHGVERIVRAQTVGNRVDVVDARTGTVIEVVHTDEPLEEVPKWCHAAVVGVGY
jgi:hypothetical protein